MGVLMLPHRVSRLEQPQLHARRTLGARRPDVLQLDILPRPAGWYAAPMFCIVRRNWRWLLAIGAVASALSAWTLWQLPATRYNAGQYASLRLGMTRDQVFQVMGTDRKSFDDMFGMTSCGSWRTIACDPIAGASLKQHRWYCYVPMGSVSKLAQASGQPQVDYWTDRSVTVGVVYRDGKVDEKLMNVRIPAWEQSLRQWLDGN
jgi:hypothetical protein